MSQSAASLPRIAIVFCTQCRWMLRAAYFAQELLSTFSTTLGEVALIPATGGAFTVTLTHNLPSQQVSADPSSNHDSPDAEPTAKTVLLWDRKAEGGFPETKVLKQRVRDHLEPTRNLGHSDTPANKTLMPRGQDAAALSGKRTSGPGETAKSEVRLPPPEGKAAECEDCANEKNC